MAPDTVGWGRPETARGGHRRTARSGPLLKTRRADPDAETRPGRAGTQDRSSCFIGGSGHMLDLGPGKITNQSPSPHPHPATPSHLCFCVVLFFVFVVCVVCFFFCCFFCLKNKTRKKNNKTKKKKQKRLSAPWPRIFGPEEGWAIGSRGGPHPGPLGSGPPKAGASYRVDRAHPRRGALVELRRRVAPPSLAVQLRLTADAATGGIVAYRDRGPTMALFADPNRFEGDIRIYRGCGDRVPPTAGAEGTAGRRPVLGVRGRGVGLGPARTWRGGLARGPGPPGRAVRGARRARPGRC